MEALKRLFSNPLRAGIGAGILLVAVAGTVLWASRETPTTLNEQAAADIVESVRNLTEVPADEQPFVRPVVHPEAFDGQTAFTDARLGDVVLIYNGARLTILFRPSEHRIIDIVRLNPLPSK